jgi:predicted RNA binding protein YcfA (HicA-like mRNA interferase family)
MKYAGVRKILERNGWMYARTKGSHHIFTKPGHRAFPVPVHHGMVKYGYVREIKKICGEET